MRILHVLDHSIPLHSGYTFRTASILREQRALGRETYHITSPKQGEARALEESVDGLHFYRTSGGTGLLADLPVGREVALMKALGQRLEQVARIVEPDIIHAHSPVLNALPALKVGHKLGMPVGHVEAGLRTGNKRAPFSEEINRKLTGPIADLHFAPTEAARTNLLHEGVNAATVHITGNTVINAPLAVTQRLKDRPELNAGFDDQFKFLDRNKKLILVTGLRRENFGEGFQNICQCENGPLILNTPCAA